MGEHGEQLSSQNNFSFSNQICNNRIYPCKPVIILPVWMPNENIELGDRLCRAAIYMIALIYAFLGSNILSDRFMTAVEVITSSEREIKVIHANGKVMTKKVRIWNETVAHLTLMEVGASASEILLAAIETAGNDFQGGELGPSAIVGSAAFTLFLMTAICVVAVPRLEVRRVQRIDVFW